jgi:hypothetical protein
MSESSLAPGTRIGPYEILSLLGQGGMGQVYKARDLRLSREVALKVLLAEVPADKDRLRRFEYEAKATSILSHPNIVAVYDVGDSEGLPYIVSELLEGRTLRDHLATQTVPPRRAVDYGVQILRGLAAAHEKSIVHRDLKPENLFLTKGGLVKILDFGIAKLGRQGEDHAKGDVETASQTTPGAMLGTVGYMSPEQVRGLAVDHRSDLFSFGAVFYEMLSGKRAFKGSSVADTLSAILREDPTEALESNPNIPADIARVVRRALEKSPDDRFQTARDLAFALEGTTRESKPGLADSPRGTQGQARVRTLLRSAGVMALVGFALWGGRRMAPTPVPAAFTRLTFRIGKVETARFAADGETIYYSARWGNGLPEVFSTRATARGERPFGLRDAQVLAVSPQEMAVLLRPKIVGWGAAEGVLARVSLAGGAPREILEGVLCADWSPDGKDLAVVHVVEDEKYRLEYPIGNVLYSPEPPAWISNLRLSPAGDQIAFLEHPVAGDKRGAISIVDRGRRKRSLASGFAALTGIGWSPSGDEVWFGASPSGGIPEQIRAVSLSGRERLVHEAPGGFEVLEVSRHGPVLGSRLTTWTDIRARARGATEEAELPAADLSFLADLSDDGRQVLGTDQGQGGGPNYRFYIQKTDGSPAVWLGEGDGQALSPDGRFALAVLVHTQPQQLIVVPVGAGQTRALEPGPIARYSRAVWDNTGRRIVFSGFDKQDSERVYIQEMAGGPPRALTPEGVTLGQLGRPVSPDDRRLAAIGPDGVPALYPLAGGDSVPIPGLADKDVVICWTPDGKELMVAHYGETPPRIERVEVATGRARPWSGLNSVAPNSLSAEPRILVTPDGESYAYNYTRSLSDLYLTSKLK